MGQINKSNSPQIPVKIRGREFTAKDIATIKQILSQNPKGSSRSQSKEICEVLNWRQANGILKDRACREVMLRMHAKGLIDCPPIRLKRRNKKSGSNARKNKIVFSEPQNIKPGVLQPSKKYSVNFLTDASSLIFGPRIIKLPRRPNKNVLFIYFVN